MAEKRKTPEDGETKERQALKRPRIEDADEEDYAALEAVAKAAAKAPEDQVCPYLDTINRKVLDFDFEKQCSVSLSNMNVYACLVCGKYFQGRGRSTHAYLHAVENSHHVFINLHTEKVYCLPDGYEVKDPSLEDIRYNLNPRFKPADLPRLDTIKTFVHGFDGTDFLPGVVGLNKIKETDWLNVMIQALSRVTPLRNFFLVESNWEKNKSSVLVSRWGELLAKLWNPRSFKGHVSPHEILQAVLTASNRRFKVDKFEDVLQPLAWFLHTLHRDLGGTKKRTSSIISRTFQGEVEATIEKEVKSRAGPRRPDSMDTSGDAEDDRKKTAAAVAADKSVLSVTTSVNDEGKTVETTVKRQPFMYLSLELPPAPVFKDGLERNIIPQVSIFELLAKFDGVTTEILPDGTKKRYTITRLPRYLIVHFRRFTDNDFFVEKNPTLVNFPLKHLDLKPYTDQHEAPSLDVLKKMSVAELKKRLKLRRIDPTGIIDKSELIARLVESYDNSTLPTKYDLVANICHEGKAGQGSYKVHVHHKGTDTWYEMQDLHVLSNETMPQQIALSETYVQIYELKEEAGSSQQQQGGSGLGLGGQ